MLCFVFLTRAKSVSRKAVLLIAKDACVCALAFEREREGGKNENHEGKKKSRIAAFRMQMSHVDSSINPTKGSPILGVCVLCNTAETNGRPQRVVFLSFLEYKEI